VPRCHVDITHQIGFGNKEKGKHQPPAERDGLLHAKLAVAPSSPLLIMSCHITTKSLIPFWFVAKHNGLAVCLENSTGDLSPGCVQGDEGMLIVEIGH